MSDGRFDDLKDFTRRFLSCDVPLRAAALAYHTILGIVPIVGLTLWYLSRLSPVRNWLELTKRFILSEVSFGNHSLFLEKFEKLTHVVQGYHWSYVSFGVLVYTSFNLIAKFGSSLDIILKTRGDHSASEVSTLVLVLRRVLVMMGMPIALTLSLVVTKWIQKDSWLHWFFELRTVGPLFAVPLAWAVTIFVMFLVYLFIPRQRVPVREALRVAVLVGLALEAIRYGFSVYAGYAVSTQRIYGVFAVVPLFVLWVQAGWIILLSGALLIVVPSEDSDGAVVDAG